MSKKYSIVYADPPWQYRDNLGKNPRYGGYTYPSMTLEEIKALPVKDIVAKDAVLFLWCTMPKLEAGLEVIKAWGFSFTTVAFVWIKINKSATNKECFRMKDIRTGIGHWTNSNAELCLLGRRGHIKRVKTNVKQIVIAPVTIHSAKPSEVRNRIVELMGDLPRLELFARLPEDGLFKDESYKGWDFWGNEVPLDKRVKLGIIKKEKA